MSSIQSKIFDFALDGDLDNLKRLLESEESQEQDLFEHKDEMGRNALFCACMLGRSAVVRELVQHGAQINLVHGGGVSPLHLAAAWGQLDTVKVLLELGADIQIKTCRGERAVDLASRYSNTDCVDCLALAEAKLDLLSYITLARDTVSDPEKVQGKLSKEEKNICLKACAATADWIQNAKDPTMAGFLSQMKHIEGILQPALSKLTA